MKLRAGRLALALLAAAWAAVLAAPSAQADEGWTITSFHSDISVGLDSSLTIREDIRVDFGSLQKHGIFRTIPLRYRYSDTQDRFYVFHMVSVNDGVHALEYADSVDSDNEVIKIGDPNQLVSGVNRYVITYTVAGAMNSFPGRDELFWNVDGALWPVPKESVTATVHLPEAAFQKAACYQGPSGSTEACIFQQNGSSVDFSSTRTLGSGEEMSVVTALNPGAVAVTPPLLEARQRQFPQDAFDLNPLTVGLSLLVAVVGIGLVARSWWVHGRDRAYLTQYYLTNDPRQGPAPLFRHEPVVVEFEIPGGMRPAELGLILDEKADSKDVTATIVDLAVRGNMTITELPGKKDWTFTWRGADPSPKLAYEQTLLDRIFEGRHEVKLSELKGTFAPTLRKAEGEIYADAAAKKLFTTRPDLARTEWGCAGVAVLIVGIAVSIVLGMAFGWGLIGVALALTGLVLTISFPFMPQRSAAGRALLQRTLGFRLYMTTAEKYRQQFAAKASIFTQLLPYAIVFGCVSMWSRAFEGIDTSQTSNWYVGTGPFQAALLAGNLEAMNAGIASAIAYTPPSSGSSSGFGGGGFSGGGGGGGGGGSW
jgi:uncharacterized membrane protein YgcG